ncbi:ABC transporter permease [Pseudonocardia oroxyli]|uniref:ABC-2 type transport system permease protein n=1 Tax=Pseudonocardia oroxyli TaxID=366584 RepID=A0A1G7RRB4_PSEOR|nr:ABC transporter permease [Pseudonocardia oroxyli]SDG13235.1 ABC-2 type transport system permease protein [Pseudonocardia oroxyli]
MSGLSPQQAIGLVARREFTTQVRSRSFAVGIVISLVIFGVYALIFQFIGSRTSSDSLGVTPAAQSMVPALQQAATVAGRTLTVVDVSAAEGAEGADQLLSGDLDAVLDHPSGWTLTGRDAVGSELQVLVSTVVRQATLDQALQAAGQNPATVAAAGAVAVQTLEPEDPERGQRLGLAIVTSVLLFMSLIGYGSAVAQGVVEEKSSRVVELLLSTIRPLHLLAGKVLGLGAVGLLQLLILGAIGVVVGSVTGVLSAPSAAGPALVAAVIWYLLGFFLYASVYAAAGSMVSRQEELQSLVAPIMFPLLLPFIFAVSVLPGDPRNTLATVLSFVPFFSPTLMPARQALGVAPWWQVLIAILLTAATIVAVVAVAARIYRNSVLRTGARVSWSEALRSS